MSPLREYIIKNWITVPKSPVVVVRNPLHQVKNRSRQAANGTVPVVSYSHVEIPSVEVLEILIKWDKILRSKRNTFSNLTVSQQQDVTERWSNNSQKSDFSDFDYTVPLKTVQAQNKQSITS